MRVVSLDDLFRSGCRIGILVDLQGRHGQQGQEGEDGNDCDVLEKEDRKCFLSARRFQEPFFVQGLKHDGRGGKREGQPDRDAGPYRGSQGQGQAGNPQGCEQNLKPPETEDRAAHAPE